MHDEDRSGAIDARDSVVVDVAWFRRGLCIERLSLVVDMGRRSQVATRRTAMATNGEKTGGALLLSGKILITDAVQNSSVYFIGLVITAG